MTIRAPFLFIETAGTEPCPALYATSQTTLAITVTAPRTARDTLRATRVVTATAGRLAAFAHRRTALSANIAVIVAGDRAAVGARLAVPESKLHKRALRVVIPQDARDERKEVQEATLCECLADGVFTFALAQKVVHHVWVGDILT